ncbi:MAG TPA: hypothetical protein DIT67_12950 [Octadecabacter sp.]|nr:hypothetical protein [Octadecabacter sp.]
MRLIQPARIQDVKRMLPKILGGNEDETVDEGLDRVHAKLRRDGRLVSVRRGTYILDADGMRIAGRHIKERNLDNARLFLMKEQRKKYRKRAGWLG